MLILNVVSETFVSFDKRYVLHIREIHGDRFIGPFDRVEADSQLAHAQKLLPVIEVSKFELTETHTLKRTWERV